MIIRVANNYYSNIMKIIIRIFIVIIIRTIAWCLKKTNSNNEILQIWIVYYYVNNIVLLTGYNWPMLNLTFMIYEYYL